MAGSTSVAVPVPFATGTSQWSLRQCCEDPFFNSRVPFADEAGFTRNGILNFHTRHIWSDINTHSTDQFRHQQWFSKFELLLLGLFHRPIRVSGAAYRHFSEDTLPQLLSHRILGMMAPQPISATPPEITLKLPTQGDG
jgi:hypothetical protein